MLFMIVLIAAYAVLWPFTRRTLASRERWRAALAAGMVVAGIAHFATPLPFVQHLPEIVPLRERHGAVALDAEVRARIAADLAALWHLAAPLPSAPAAPLPSPRYPSC